MVVCQKILLEKSSHFWKLLLHWDSLLCFLAVSVCLQQFEVVGYTIHYEIIQIFLSFNLFVSGSFGSSGSSGSV